MRRSDAYKSWHPPALLELFRAVRKRVRRFPSLLLMLPWRSACLPPCAPVALPLYNRPSFPLSFPFSFPLSLPCSPPLSLPQLSLSFL